MKFLGVPTHGFNIQQRKPHDCVSRSINVLANSGVVQFEFITQWEKGDGGPYGTKVALTPEGYELLRQAMRAFEDEIHDWKMEGGAASTL